MQDSFTKYKQWQSYSMIKIDPNYEEKFTQITTYEEREEKNPSTRGDYQSDDGESKFVGGMDGSYKCTR